MKYGNKRRAERLRYEVRWDQYGTIYMRWYKRIDAAKRLAAELEAKGYDVILADCRPQ